MMYPTFWSLVHRFRQRKRTNIFVASFSPKMLPSEDVAMEEDELEVLRGRAPRHVTDPGMQQFLESVTPEVVLAM